MHFLFPVLNQRFISKQHPVVKWIEQPRSSGSEEDARALHALRTQEEEKTILCMAQKSWD